MWDHGAARRGGRAGPGRRGVRHGVVDATGLIVTPGLVDLHTHVYWGVAPLGVEPDPNCLRAA